MVCTDAIVYFVILFSGCIFVICVICRTTSHHPMNMIITRFCMKLYRPMSRTWSSRMKLTRHGVMQCCQMCRRCLLSGKCASKPFVCINDYQTANVVHWRQEGHPACKNWVVRLWLSVWSEDQMICIWSSWCHCHPIISCCSKIQNGLPFWCQITQVDLEKNVR